MARNKYYFNVKPEGYEDSKVSALDVNKSIQDSARDGAQASALSHMSEKKARYKMRKRNPNFATLEDAI